MYLPTDYYVLTELNRRYAFVQPVTARLAMNRLIVGRYGSRIAAVRVAIMYNRRQRDRTPGWVDVSQAWAVWRRAQELQQFLPTQGRYEFLALSPYCPSGYFDVSHVMRPADRDLWTSPSHLQVPKGS